MFAVAGALFSTGNVAVAHLGFHGQTTVRLYVERTELILKLNPQDAWMLLESRPSFDDAGIAEGLALLKGRAPGLYEISGGGVTLPAQSAVVTQEVDGNLAFVIQYPPVSWPLRIRVAFSRAFGRDFQVPVSVFDLRENRFASDPEPIAGAIQTEHNATLEVAEPKAAPVASSPEQPAASGTLAAKAPAFREFLHLGIAHILTGYDHLLFLLALLVACRRVRPMLMIVTSFTLAHSLTLALAALDLVRVSGRIVEPLIAASIVCVGVENLVWGETAKGRPQVAFGFGLIHGFGFAGVLREIGLGAGGSSVALPLFSFNLGVELGQLAVASVALPLLFLVRKIPAVNRYATPVVSALVILCAGYWLVERLRL